MLSLSNSSSLKAESLQGQETRAEQVRRRIRVAQKEVDLAEEARVAAGRVREQAAKDGADDDADVEGHGQEEEGARLVFLFADGFADPVLCV